jgi:hypothetical protein
MLIYVSTIWNDHALSYNISSNDGLNLHGKIHSFSHIHWELICQAMLRVPEILQGCK